MRENAMIRKIVLGLLCGFFFHAAGADAQRSHVLLISIDSLRPAIYLDPAAAGVAVPNLSALMRRGVYADRVISVFPSVTYPAHTTMVTGVNPDRHLVTSNFHRGTLEWLSAASDIHATTLWQVAKKAGLTTAAVMWPMTYGADVDWLIVESAKTHTRKEGLRAALQQGATKGLLEQMEKKTGQRAAESAPQSVQVMDQMSATYTAQILKDHKPDLTLVHFLEADHMQHEFGPGSAEAARAFEHIDAYIGTLLAALKAAGIEDRTDVIIVGDHGSAPVHTAINTNRLLLDLGYAHADNGVLASDLVTFESVAGSGAFYPKPGATPQALAEFTSKLEALVSTRYRTLLTVIAGQRLRDLGGYPGAVAALSAAPGYMVVPVSGTQMMVATHHFRGMHGYLPDMPEMATGLIAAGPDFRQGWRFPVLRLLDLAPTMAAILGLKLPEAQGSIIAGALNTPADPDSPL
jgi:predicted AlkP superfamily pyrophosphatase or phosphodiesterase